MTGRLLILISLLISAFCFGQDTIFTKYNSKILVKVKEITSSEIKYLNYPIQDGVINNIPREKVSLIIYANGTTEEFHDKPQPQVNYTDIRQLEFDAKLERITRKQKKRESDKELTLKRKNYVCFNLFEFFDHSLGLSYSRNILKNYANIYVPVSFGYGDPSFTNGTLNENIYEYKMNKKAVDAGLGINYNIKHFTYGTIYVGFLFRFAQFNGEFNYGGLHNNNFVLNRYYNFATFGYRLRTPSQFTLTFNIHAGTYKNEYVVELQGKHSLNGDPRSGSAVNLSFQLGYNF